MARKYKIPKNETAMAHFERITAENMMTLLHNYYDVRRYFEIEQEKKAKTSPDGLSVRHWPDGDPMFKEPKDGKPEIVISDVVVECPRCDGKGRCKTYGFSHAHAEIEIDCPDCQGTGKKTVGCNEFGTLKGEAGQEKPGSGLPNEKPEAGYTGFNPQPGPETPPPECQRCEGRGYINRYDEQLGHFMREKCPDCGSREGENDG